jgi:hypothetical protein
MKSLPITVPDDDVGIEPCYHERSKSLYLLDFGDHLNTFARFGSQHALWDMEVRVAFQSANS